MRTDYILYAIAIVCFIIAGVIGGYNSTGNPIIADTTTGMLIVIALAIIGIVFIGSGYSLRPKTPAAPVAKPLTPPAPPETPKTEEQPAAPTLPPPKEEEKAPPEAPQETPPETKKPARKRRERKKT